MSTQYVVQTRTTRKYTELFSMALDAAKYTDLYVAVAYATVGGVRTIEKTIQTHVDSQAWDSLKKCWLVGIDWCRSDPPALERLQGMKNSEVRVPNGRVLIVSEGCVPRDTYHPKLFIFDGTEATAVICGSGNLSANGLTKGCECGNLLIFKSDGGKAPRESQEPQYLLQWFDSAWTSATPYKEIKDTYEARCRKRIKRGIAVPTEDDAKPPVAQGGLSEEQIRQMRSYSNFWIEAGALGANLGKDQPGNQLDMKRFSRVFFGASIEELAPNTIIDVVTLFWEGRAHKDRTLKFGDNGMDKLNVPPPGEKGPMFYKGKTLHFIRMDDGSFLFDVGNEAQKNKWRSRSTRVGFSYRYPGGREWGLF